MNKDDHRQQVLELGLHPEPLAKVIRKHCYECQGFNWCAVNKCDNQVCRFYAYRFGFNPFNKKSNNPHISEIGKSALSGEQINHNYQYKLNRPLNHNQLKGKTCPMTSQIPKVAPEASTCAKPKKRELPELEENLLYFIYDKLVLGETIFHKSDIENLYVKKYHTAGTKGRKYRLLNAKHNISECINRSKSKHLIIKTKTEINEILRSYGL
ncbi:MAG: hypothetical protein ABIJ12_00430 [bacterium]